MVAVGFELCDGFPSSGGNLVELARSPHHCVGFLFLRLGPSSNLGYPYQLISFKFVINLPPLTCFSNLSLSFHHISPVLVVPHAEVSKTGNL